MGENGTGQQLQIQINAATHADRSAIAALYVELGNLARAHAELMGRCIILERELLRLKAEAPAPAVPLV